MMARRSVNWGIGKVVLAESGGCRRILAGVNPYLLLSAYYLLQTSPAPFGPGEELRYEVTWLGVHSGSAQIDVGSPKDVDGIATWPLVCVARSEGLADSLYHVRNRFVSFWDFARRETVEGDFSQSEAGKIRHAQCDVSTGVRRKGPVAQVGDQRMPNTIRS